MFFVASLFNFEIEVKQLDLKKKFLVIEKLLKT